MPHFYGSGDPSEYELRVYVDDFDKVMIAPYSEVLREAHEMARTAMSNKSNVERYPGVGWRLRDHAFTDLDRWEHEIPAGIESTAADIETPAGAYVDYFSYRGSDILPGVFYAGTVPGEAFFNAMKVVSANLDWDDTSLRLQSDMDDWPDPVTGREATDMDRFIRSKDVLLPDTGLFITTSVPRLSYNDMSLVDVVHFSGPPGSEFGLDGAGRYALARFGDGFNILYEALLDSDGIPTDPPQWASRFSFRRRHGPSYYVQERLGILTNATRACGGKWQGNKIHFLVDQSTNDREDVDGLALMRQYNTNATRESVRNVVTFTVPQDKHLKWYPSYFRVSVRRDVRMAVNLRKSGHTGPGKLIDDPFALPNIPYTDPDNVKKLAIRWYGDKPPGADITVQVFKAGHAEDPSYELPVRTALKKESCTGDYWFFDLPPIGWRHLQAVYTWTNTDTPGNTCTLAQSQVFVAAYKKTPSRTKTLVAPVGQRDGSGNFIDKSLVLSTLTAITTTEPGQTLDKEHFNVTIEDPGRASDILFNRAGTPISLVLYKKDDDTEIVIKRGLITSPSATFNAGGKLAFDGSDRVRKYPDYNNKSYELSCYGEHSRLDRRLLGSRARLIDPATGKAYNVCKKMRDILTLEGGYNNDQVILPESSIQFFISDNSAASTIEPQTRMKPLLSEWAVNYLGGFWVFDTSAHSYGAWRLIQRKTPPYIPLIRFTTEPPHSSLTLSLQPPQYGASTVSDQPVVHMPVMAVDNRVKGSERWEPPEANCVVVIGGGIKSPSPTLASDGITGASKAEVSAGMVDTRISQVAVNVKSYNALLLDPSHAKYPTPERGGRDYLGEFVPVYAYQATLGTQSAVNWLCRRMYDYIAHARAFRRIRSWMPLLTDVHDTYQIKPRIPRFYDAVQVWDEETGKWVDYVISDCNIVGMHDNLMMMDYLLVRTEAFSEFASPLPSFGAFANMARIVREALDQSGNKGASKVTHEIDSRTIVGRGPWTALPELPSEPIQDLDPDSPTFGKFKWMLNYDKPG